MSATCHGSKCGKRTDVALHTVSRSGAESLTPYCKLHLYQMTRFARSREDQIIERIPLPDEEFGWNDLVMSETKHRVLKFAKDQFQAKVNGSLFGLPMNLPRRTR